MTPLTQQLEDKKKGCEKKVEYTNDYFQHYINCGNKFANTDKILCKTCQAEIAILEQAIAEMQKQRQEILDKIEKICNDNQMYADMDEDEFWRTSKISPQDAQKRADYNYELFEYLIKQLNQPKTE